MQRLAGLIALMLLFGCGPATSRGTERRGRPVAYQTVILPLRPGPAIEISEAEFSAAMAWLTKDLSSLSNRHEVRIVRAAFNPGATGGLNDLQAWQFQQNYAAWCASQYQGPDCQEILRDGTGFTADARRALALAIALASAWRGVADEIRDMLSPAWVTAFISTTMVGYTAMWTLPEPWSKGLGAVFTAALWVYLGSEFLDFVSGWIDMIKEADAATSFSQVYAAGERFGHRIGEKTVRLVVMLATAAFAPKGNFEAKMSKLPGYAEAAQVPGLGRGSLLARITGKARVVVASRGKLQVTEGAMAMEESGLLPTESVESLTREPPAAEQFSASGEPAALPREQPAGGTAGARVGSELRQITETWAQQFETQPARGAGAPRDFQVRYCGPTETRVAGGGVEVWADGILSEEGMLQDAKLIEKPSRSPFVDAEPHPVPDHVREQILDKVHDELVRYAKVIHDPSTPIVGLEIVTNAQESVPFWTRMLKAHGIPGRVVVRPWP